jgi:heme exporter protein A
MARMTSSAADSSPEFAIEAEGVARRFGARWVLRGVSLRIAPGEVVGLLGANGSGKTTLLRILSTLLRASAGTAAVHGFDVVREADDVRRHVGFLAHAPGLYDDLTARENLTFAAAMLGSPSADVNAVLDRVGLSDVATDRVRGFSAGMQRRLALARLLLAKPRILLLDEPYSHLDTSGVALMNAVIEESADGGATALMVLHEMTPAEGILDRTLTIRDGRLDDRRTSGGFGAAIPDVAGAAG